MLRVTLPQVEPGMVLAASLVHPQHPAVTLLKPGAVLDMPCIERLREMHVGEVWIEYPKFESLRRFLSPDVLVTCRETTLRLARVMDQVVSRPAARLDYHAFRQATTLVIEALSSSPGSALFIMEMAENLAPPLRHACNVCSLSVLMGLKLEAYITRERGRPCGWRELSSLGVGAMLHDVAMLELDAEVLARWRATRDAGDPAYREHAERGAELVRREFDPAAAAAVLHHHQGYDGSGFPGRLDSAGRRVAPAGSEIHVFARIVAVADTFDALRHPDHESASPHAAPDAMATVRALRIMLRSPLARTFDPVVLRALLGVVPAFQPGATVVVESDRGERLDAMVADWNPLDPCRPSVRVMTNRVPGEKLDLAQRRDLSIAEIDGFDVRDDQFAPEFSGDFDLRQAMRRSLSGVGDHCRLELKPEPGVVGVVL